MKKTLPSKQSVQFFTLSKSLCEHRVGDHLVSPSRGIFIFKDLCLVHVDGALIPSMILDSGGDNTTLVVPIAQIESGALRPLASKCNLRKAIAVLCERRCQRRIVWARRVQNYEAKLKTGNPLLLAEVLRDLYRPGEQSFRERQIVKRALDRLTAETAVVMGVEYSKAQQQIVEKLLSRGYNT